MGQLPPFLPLTVTSGVTDRPCMETGPLISRISDFQKAGELEFKKKKKYKVEIF